jgi:A/G-specific adenine glycosylase
MATGTKKKIEAPVTPLPERLAGENLTAAEIVVFRRRLMQWFRKNARKLPWRGVNDPYRTWVSEIMLQQTRVTAVIEHYNEFLVRFPTVLALSLAREAEVLAAWSGLGYYRRARMLHKTAQFVTQERKGKLPTDSVGLRTLPGIGEYTCAAIASISFGESVAAVDGNVERVLLRITGRPHVSTAAGKAFVLAQATALVPRRKVEKGVNAAGDHNEAMMELGATVCTPKAPLCAKCPMYSLCLTRGEHVTSARTVQRSLPAAYLLNLRKVGTVTEVLMHRRPANASLMAGMLELPPLPEEAVTGREPLLRVRHSITNTNYYVQVFAARSPRDKGLMKTLMGRDEAFEWVRTNRLAGQPLTGLARKVLQRLDVMAVRPVMWGGPIKLEIKEGK